MTPLSSESSSSSESSEPEDSSSYEDEKSRKKANGKKKKNRRMTMPEKGSTSIVSKVDALVKDFADLKVHVVGGREKRKSTTGLRANLWCTNCGRVGHANVECQAYQPVNAVKWVPAWEANEYYTENLEETAYVVQEGPPVTPIQQAHIPRYAPKEMATTVPQRRMAPPGATARAPLNACFNCGEVGHYSPNCPHP